MKDMAPQMYDRASTVFSPDGRLYQVEYAREAVKRGTTAVGIKVREGVVLLVDKRVSIQSLPFPPSPFLRGERLTPNRRSTAIKQYVSFFSPGNNKVGDVSIIVP